MCKIIGLLGGDEKLQKMYKDELLNILKDSKYKVGASQHCSNVNPKKDYFIIYNNYDEEQFFDLSEKYQCHLISFSNYDGIILEHMKNKIIYEIEEPDIETDVENIFDILN